MKKQTALICDDEKLLRDILCDFLENAGFVVIEAVDGQDGYDKFVQFQSQIVVAILDVMMPILNGFILCEKIRELDTQIPIIMLTAKNDEEDELRSFSAGADDFIPKPLRPSIVIARVQAILKRKIKLESDMEQIEYEKMQIIPHKYEVLISGESINLNKKEYEILLLLWNNRNQTLTREQILAAVWGYDAFVTNRAIDTNITRLRGKLGEKNEFIKTVRGYGYVFEVNDDKEIN